MGMIVKVTVQKLSRKGICVAAAASWRPFAATAVYCRILSRVSNDLGNIGDSGRVFDMNPTDQ